jgi:hypothetical protein
VPHGGPFSRLTEMDKEMCSSALKSCHAHGVGVDSQGGIYVAASTSSCGKAKRYGGQKCGAETGSGFRQIDAGPEADYASLVRPEALPSAPA